ncbi:MAG: hypothetical protein HOP36_03395 [Methyloglobulus sp.]|jgi:hypothetical protein|nr:hypothetical protein [Methyloglobulus sp.]
MSLLDDDLVTLNYQYLSLARDCVLNRPLEALWKFNLTESQSQKLAGMSIRELMVLAQTGRSILSIAMPDKPTGIPPALAYQLAPFLNTADEAK